MYELGRIIYGMYELGRIIYVLMATWGGGSPRLCPLSCFRS